MNIEGLGRQLYPELDLWATAHPFLEKWLKERFKPKALLNRLERHGPEWLEQFPKVPQLLYESLEHVRNLEQATLKAAPANGWPRRRWVGAALAGTGLGFAGAQWMSVFSSVPTFSLVLTITGALLLLLR